MFGSISVNVEISRPSIDPSLWEYFSMKWVRRTFLQFGHQSVDNVLHGSVVSDIIERVTLMDKCFALWARVLLLQMLDETALAD